jgi:hypothetical protein
MSTLLSSLEVAAEAQNGITGGDFQQNISTAAGIGFPIASKNGGSARAGEAVRANQQVLESNWSVSRISP